MKAKYLTIICTTFALAVTSSVALAQTSTETKIPEIKLSSEGMKILCERFPLNSRCPGGATSSTTTTPSTSTPETEPSPNPTAPDPATPDNTTPGTSETPPPTDTTSPGVPGGAGDTINNPAMPPADGSTPGTSETPPPTDTTSPGVPGGTGNGTIPEGSAPGTPSPSPMMK